MSSSDDVLHGNKKRKHEKSVVAPRKSLRGLDLPSIHSHAIGERGGFGAFAAAQPYPLSPVDVVAKKIDAINRIEGLHHLHFPHGVWRHTIGIDNQGGGKFVIHDWHNGPVSDKQLRKSVDHYGDDMGDYRNILKGLLAVGTDVSVAKPKKELVAACNAEARRMGGGGCVRYMQMLWPYAYE